MGWNNVLGKLPGQEGGETRRKGGSGDWQVITNT